MLITSSAESIHFVTAEEHGSLAWTHDGLTIHEIDVPIRSRKEFFSLLAKAMRFPDYCAHNWDAVDECLRDGKAAPGEGIVLVIHHAETFWKSDPRTAGALIEVWLGASEQWRAARVGFHLVFVW